MQNDYFGWMSPVVPGLETNTGDAENRPTMRLSPASPVSPVIPDSKQQPEAALLSTLAHCCRGLAVTPSEVRAAMSDDDMRDWRPARLPMRT